MTGREKLRGENKNRKIKNKNPRQTEKDDTEDALEYNRKKDDEAGW